MTDYKNTVFLPQTDFPLRAGLAQKEPEIIKKWNETGLHEKLLDKNRGNTPFVLHDGPPFANANIHIGHALNKILKDVVNRTKRMEGYHIDFTPGWDCHGLPIEWKIEEGYRAKGQNKDEVPVPQFMDECRAFAAKWIDVQREDFKRLGVDANWDTPYVTMSADSEAKIAREILKFAENGSVYRGEKSVMWSVVEQTALAEAEVEYKDHKSTTIWVKFPVVSSPLAAVHGAQVVIWTTTPWTMPANQALAYGEEMDYAVYTVDETGEKLVLAVALADSVKEAAKIESWTQGEVFKGAALDGTICHHPLHGQGYDEDRPLWAADFVTEDAGTGFVHIAPSHGEDDFNLGQEKGVKLSRMVGPDGVYYDHVPLFAGKRILTEDGKEGDANGAVISAIAHAGGLLAKGRITHSYPHSWRSKAPVIFRCTPQWYCSVEKGDLRTRALKAIDETQWFPSVGRNRIRSMVENRSDWCISRQRTWGVPLPFFVRKSDGELLIDADVNSRIYEIFLKEGANAWHIRPASDFLGSGYNPEDFEQVFDIVDVWFESGSTHAFVLEEGVQADLYLEGSDQHRGWFQSSLLESVGTRGCAPYKAVLTHGFTLDEKGYKMSKSLGNVVAPQDVTEKYGADVLRVMIINCDYNNDIVMGETTIKHQSDIYRRLRNTLRYLLGALDDFTEEERIEDVSSMPLLERWVLHRLCEIDERRKAATDVYEYNRAFRMIHDFCANDLSSFYLDVRKDALYCDAPTSFTRRAARTVMEQLFLSLTAWLAPVLCFTTEEAWQCWRNNGHGDAEESVHLRSFPDSPAHWRNNELGEQMALVRQVRSRATNALEVKRGEKEIRSSLEATVALELTDEERAAVEDFDMAEICITSGATLITPQAADESKELSATVSRADGEKCERCWKILPEVGQDPVHPTLCLRCAEVIGEDESSSDPAGIEKAVGA